jgi:squalene-hopene/tetraprenyl-beta-curcumene cyclase
MPEMPGPVPPAVLLAGKLREMLTRVASATGSARKFLFSLQHADGCWCGELEADTTLESDYIAMHTLLGTGSPERMRKSLRWILDHQNSDGGWPIYEGGPSEVSASVKAYFALKLMDYGMDDPVLTRARACIESLGGVTSVNTYTKIYLCFFGQYDWDAVPAIPPEIVLFPNWFWFNIYEISAWSRAIFIPLSIVYAKKPFKKIPRTRGIQELFPNGDMHSVNLHLKWSKRLVSWRNFFLFFDRMTHWFERVHVRPLRSMALRKAERWMLERFEMSDGMGAIYPAMMNAIIALRCLGYSVDDPQFIRAMDEFEALGIEEAASFRMQPCKPPVWDTAYALLALGEAGVPRNDAGMVKAADFILQKQVTHKGDWAVKVRNVAPAGWYFEFNNEFYPDVDDTAQVLLGLSHVDHPNGRYLRETVERAVAWVLAMQCKEGGWASFDRDNTKMMFQYIPFADHNAMLDPPTVDITGRVLEMLAAHGYTRAHPAVARALKFILKAQEPDGSWFGRWGVNYIYGTMCVLRGLQAIGIEPDEPYIQQAAQWLRMVQNPDGGWGESCMSYDDPTTRGVGPSTASQTAWAVLGLLAIGDTRSDAISRGVEYLLRTQREDGSWHYAQYTGTGFPRVFYLKYHLYSQYFPLMALASYSSVFSGEKVVAVSNPTHAQYPALPREGPMPGEGRLQ